MSFCADQSFFTGINYWASHEAIHMWSRWDAAVVEEDFKKLSGAGVTVLRVFPLWPVFQPLTGIFNVHGVYEYRFGEEPLPDTEAGRAGVSEAACERFEAFCALAEKHGLKLVVGLVTGQMSFRHFMPPALEGRNALTDPTVIKWTVRFVRYFVRRFKDQRCIAAWDLGNECNIIGLGGAHPDASYVWTSAITGAIRREDGDRPIVSGMETFEMRDGAFNMPELGEQTDVQTCHPYNIFRTGDPLCSLRPINDAAFRCAINESLSGRPTFVEEIGSIGYQAAGEKSEAAFYRAVLYSAWTHGCHGVMWWCAFDQGKMTYAPYDWNNIGSEYGFFRSDGSAKPIAAENQAFRRFMDSLPFGELPERLRDAVCLIPRGAKIELLRTADALSRQANIEFTYADALEKIPEADVYFMPSVDSNHAILRRRLIELLERVEQGAILYLSFGEALFRWVPQITGVTFSGRERAYEPQVIELNGKRLPVTGGYRHTVEACQAEVLAEANGRPVFFRHAYGKGFVYTLTLPVEDHLDRQPEAFYAPDAPCYADIYRAVMEHAPKRRAADCEDAAVNLTEHPLADGRRVLAAVNYGAAARTARLTLRPGWRVESVLRGRLDGSLLTVDACDAAVLTLARED